MRNLSGLNRGYDAPSVEVSETKTPIETEDQLTQLDAQKRRSFRGGGRVATLLIVGSGSVFGFGAGVSLATQLEGSGPQPPPAPKLGDVLNNIHNNLSQKAQPLAADESVSFVPSKEVLRNLAREDNNTDKITRVRVRQEIGSKTLSLIVSQNDTMLTGLYGMVVRKTLIPGLNGRPDYWDESPIRSLPSYVVSPDIVVAKEVEAQPVVMSSKGRTIPLGPKVKIPPYDNFVFQEIDTEIKEGTVVNTPAGGFKADKTGLLVAQHNSSVKLSLDKPLSRALKKRGVFIKLIQRSKGRDAADPIKKSKVVSKFGPFKYAKQSKTIPKL